MIALLRKELRQVVPGHLTAVLLFSLVVLWGLEPRDVLLPTGFDLAALYFAWAGIAMIEGLLIGLVQFGRERVAGTEAYLVHRATGRLQPFLAKVAAATAALGLVVATPPAVYGLWNVVLFPSVERPLTGRLAYFLVAGSCGLPAYAVGAVCSQLRKAWGTRVLLSVLGACTVLFVTAVASQPPAGAERTPVVPFLVLQAGLATAVLAVAYRLFRAGEDETRPWPGKLALAAALVSLALFWLPWVFGIATAQQFARTMVFDPYPQIVEDDQAQLWLVREVSPQPEGPGRPAAWVREFDFRDALGNRLDDERTRKYSGFGFDRQPFLTIFDPTSTPLAWDHPWNDIEQSRGRAGPFGFDGRWVQLPPFHSGRSSRWFRPVDGTVHCTSSSPTEEFAARHEVLGRPGDPMRFSPRTVVVPGGWVVDMGRADLVDLADRTIWTLDPTSDRCELVPESLPDGDSLVGLERLQSLFRLRAGLYEPFGVSDHLLYVGERDRYVRTPRGLVPIGELTQEMYSATGVPEGDAARVLRWRLEPSRIDGFGFHLDVVDVQSGEVALAHDFRPDTWEQQKWAAIAWASSLARPPAGALWSWLAAPFEPRDVSRLTTHDAFRDPLLLGGANPLLLVACVAAGLLLAASAHRRLGRDPRERALRWTWTVAVFALGLPAWGLCLLLEPSRRALARPEGSRVAPRPRIVTERVAREPRAASTVA